MQTQIALDRAERPNLLADIQQAYVYTMDFGEVALDSRQEGMLENLWERRIRSVGVGALNLGGEFCLQGKMDDFGVDMEGKAAVHRQIDTLREKFEQDTLAPYGSLAELGTDAYATYVPIHQIVRGQNTLPAKAFWGIYISEDGLCRLAAKLQYHCVQEYGKPTEDLFLQTSYQILLRQCLAHFKLEAFTLSAELVRREPLYLRYLANVYLALHRQTECLEDAIANATILSSQTVSKLFAKMYPSGEDGSGISRCEWKSLIEKYLLSCQPPGYRDYTLSKYPRKESVRGSSARREAMNYLCNQVISGTVLPKVHVPFYAFPPDNYFLRGELLVPVHIIRKKQGIKAFMRRVRRK